MQPSRSPRRHENRPDFATTPNGAWRRLRPSRPPSQVARAGYRFPDPPGRIQRRRSGRGLKFTREHPITVHIRKARPGAAILPTLWLRRLVRSNPTPLFPRLAVPVSTVIWDDLESRRVTALHQRSSESLKLSDDLNQL